MIIEEQTLREMQDYVNTMPDDTRLSTVIARVGNTYKISLHEASLVVASATKDKRK